MTATVSACPSGSGPWRPRSRETLQAIAGGRFASLAEARRHVAEHLRPVEVRRSPCPGAGAQHSSPVRDPLPGRRNCLSAPAETLLEVRGLEAYAGVHAARGLLRAAVKGDPRARGGERRGESTLVKIITGAVVADDGRCRSAVGPSSTTRRGRREPWASRHLPAPALFPDLSVAENMATHLEPAGVWRRVRWETTQGGQAAAREVGARIDPEQLAGRLSISKQQSWRSPAPSGQARVILDEFHGPLSEADTRNLFAVIRRLSGQGVGMIIRIASGCRTPIG
jgi:ABC-type branched-subunit amino acid transport system ATPase component